MAAMAPRRVKAEAEEGMLFTAFCSELRGRVDDPTFRHVSRDLGASES